MKEFSMSKDHEEWVKKNYKVFKDAFPNMPFNVRYRSIARVRQFGIDK